MEQKISKGKKKKNAKMRKSWNKKSWARGPTDVFSRVTDLSSRVTRKHRFVESPIHRKSDSSKKSSDY